MDSLTVTDVRPFVPARDFAASRDFYVALGWTLLWEDERLALLELGDHDFYLQNCSNDDVIGEHMLFVEVENAQAWHTHVSAILQSKKFPAARLDEPKIEHYSGAIVVRVEDPSGVVLHLAQPGASHDQQGSE